ncbi:3-deoxy-D-manno-octulosonic acid transferase [Algirhabdus cladophorae]|uniref:3-deoxy-D-manno-octulosonic acid transferase n=1 Tax=Algirhabdus cladophorae TaxID=3377108 RepID=UPI003B847E44
MRYRTGVIYRFLISLALMPLMWFAWRKRSLTHARFGLIPATPDVPHLWIHGASNGELAAARPLIHAMLCDPQRHILITCNSASALEMLTGWNLPRVRCALAPLDLRWAVGQVLDRANVTGYIGIEAEFWPNRFDLLGQRGLPICLVGARLSQNTARRLQRVGFAKSMIIDALDLVSPQDAQSAQRFADLGLEPAQIGPLTDLKTMYVPADPDPRLHDMAAHYPKGATILAASVHVGEDIMVASAFVEAQKLRPDLRLILAPRHPDRIGPLLAWLKDQKIAYAQHSQDEVPDATTQITVADTLGEMALWYDLADLCFVGGSLVEAGGHTPFEPLGHGCRVVHGPLVSNFAQTYADLDSAGTTQCVQTAQELSIIMSRPFEPAPLSGHAPADLKALCAALDGRLSPR